MSRKVRHNSLILVNARYLSCLFLGLPVLGALFDEGDPAVNFLFLVALAHEVLLVVSDHGLNSLYPLGCFGIGEIDNLSTIFLQVLYSPKVDAVKGDPPLILVLVRDLREELLHVGWERVPFMLAHGHIEAEAASGLPRGCHVLDQLAYFEALELLGRS